MHKILLAAAAAATLATPAISQVNTGSGLVAVNVQDVSVLNNFLNHDQIAALNNLSVPVTVQVPIGVAANVCNISAAVLAKQAAGAAPCDAKSGSKALAQNVISQKLNQKRGH
jgi:hypothetical protein